jgi:alkylation response protein AidB-like acyl-CoA dehydrogenase
VSTDFAADLGPLRAEAAEWLETQLNGAFSRLRGLTDHTSEIEARRAWERALGEGGWSCIGWPHEFGGRNASLAEQIVFAEEYARARAPARIGHIGIELAGPTILAFGNEHQKARFLPDIAGGRTIWCQGYSEPDAGSDLAGVRTKARLQGDRWIIDGQKIWTSMGLIADWCLALCRCQVGSVGSKGLIFLLVPMNQTGVTACPIRQMTGDAEFTEIFFDSAQTAAGNAVGAPGEGWKVAMALLGFERGVSTLAQQMGFRNELAEIVALAWANGRQRDPLIRQKVAQAYTGLQIMRTHAQRMLADQAGGQLSSAALTYKLFWSNWHRDVGELAMQVAGPRGEIGLQDGRFPALTRMFLMSRADTIYAGTNEIQRNIIAERGLGLPREVRLG